MNKENKRKSLFFTLFATFLLIIMALLCVVPTSSVVYASAEEDISVQSDVSTNDVRSRYKTYTPDYVTSNICLDTQYYDSSVVNDTNNGILKDDVYSWSNGANVMNNNINEMVFTLNLRNLSFLGIETFAVGQSSCQYFKEDTSTGIFNAYYLKNVWLSSKDANGSSMNLFLDINVSYKDFYYPFVRDGIFTQ